MSNVAQIQLDNLSSLPRDDSSVGELVPHYKVWPGKNRFMCGGRLITGPSDDCGPNVCVWAMILIPTNAFFALTGPQLWGISKTMYLVVACFYFWVLVTLCLTGFTDPGIIPRNKKPPFPIKQSFIRRPYNDKMMGFKWCSTCNIYKPPAASHCGLCDNCVTQFDHHCPFVGNCIAERNYPYFLSFLGSVLGLLMSVLIGTITVADAGRVSAHRVAADEAATATAAEDDGFGGNWFGIVFVAVYSVIMCLTMGTFFSFHMSLLCTGQTTKQRLKPEQKYEQVQPFGPLPAHATADGLTDDPLEPYIVYPSGPTERTRFLFWSRPVSRISPTSLVLSSAAVNQNVKNAVQSTLNQVTKMGY